MNYKQLKELAQLGAHIHVYIGDEVPMPANEPEPVKVQAVEEEPDVVDEEPGDTAEGPAWEMRVTGYRVPMRKKPENHEKAKAFLVKGDIAPIDASFIVDEKSGKTFFKVDVSAFWPKYDSMDRKRSIEDGRRFYYIRTDEEKMVWYRTK